MQDECSSVLPRPARPEQALLCDRDSAGERRRGAEEQTDGDVQVSAVAMLITTTNICCLLFVVLNWLTE